MFFSFATFVCRLRRYAATMIVLFAISNICECWKISVLQVLTNASLIISIVIDNQVCSAGCCHERSIFHVPRETNFGHNFRF